MLYQTHDLARACIEPMAHLAHAYAALLDSPFTPHGHMPAVRQTVAACELAYRLGKRYERATLDIASVKVGASEVEVSEEVVTVRPFCRLLHFKQVHAMRPQPVVLLVAPLAGNRAGLLRETVRELLKDHEVYVTEWTDARTVPPEAGGFGLTDYVHYVQDFIGMLGTGLHADLHIVAVCQATVPVLGAVSLMASRGARGLPRSLTLISGPVDTRYSPTQVNRFATSRPLAWFEDTMIHTVPQGYPGAGRRVYPGFVQHACFVAMHPARHAASYRDFYERRCRGEDTTRHCAFYDDYNATLDLTAEFYLDNIDTVFQQCRLARGTWLVDGEPVRPQDIRDVALLTIEGERDDITAPGQTAAALALCAGIARADKHQYVAPGCGHYATFSGRTFRDTICPLIRDFIDDSTRTHVALQAA